MTEFKLLVERCFEKEIDRDIENSAFEHAEILAKNLFKAAKKYKEDVYIVSGLLNKRFYEPLTSSVKDVLTQQKVKVIVLDKADLKNHDFANAIVESPNGELYQAKGKYEIIPHFILVGNKRYRLETDHAKTIAVGNFNNISIGELLHKAFQSFWNSVHPA